MNNVCIFIVRLILIGWDGLPVSRLLAEIAGFKAPRQKTHDPSQMVSLCHSLVAHCQEQQPEALQVVEMLASLPGTLAQYNDSVIGGPCVCLLPNPQ